MKTGVALFVYNRPNHTVQVLDGLRKNNIKKLYIFADGPKKEEHLPAIKEVREIIDAIDWCQTEIIVSEKNKGLANSIVDGVNYVLERHERIIVLEDDCVPSNTFIDFMEQCFDKYQDDERIMNVTGYSLPIDLPQNYPFDIYFVYRSCSWGWGTWKRAWRRFSREFHIYYEINEDENFKKMVNYAGPDLIAMLESQIQGKIDSWAVFWSLSIIKNNGLCISPVKSRIRNIGLDGSGAHCGKTDVFDVKLADEEIKPLIFPPLVTIDEDICQKHRGMFFEAPIPADIAIRFKMYYQLLNKWLYVLHNGISIMDFLKARGIKNIAIYGTGEIGLRVYEELKNTDIIIQCFLTGEIKNDTFYSIKTITINQLNEIENLDLIIVTPIYDIQKIKNDISQIKPGLLVLSIESIINCLYYEINNS